MGGPTRGPLDGSVGGPAPEGGSTPMSRRDAIISRLRERRAGFGQGAIGPAPHQMEGFSGMGGLRSRWLNRHNTPLNPSAPPVDNGPV